MFTAENLALLQQFIDKNRDEDLINYEEIQVTQVQLSSLKEEDSRSNLELNKQLISTQSSLSNLEQEMRNINIPAQVQRIAGFLVKTIVQPRNPLDQLREAQRNILQTRDTINEQLSALAKNTKQESKNLEEKLTQLNLKKENLNKDYEALKFWLDRHAGKPLTTGLKRLEERVLSGAKDILKLTDTHASLTDINHFFNTVGGQISDEWKRLPKEVQMVLIVAAAIALAYGAVYFVAASGVETSVSLAVSQQGLAINLLTYTVGGGIQVAPTLAAVVGGVAAWQEFYRQSKEDDFAKHQTFEAEQRMRKEQEEFSRKKSEELRRQMDASKNNDDNNAQQAEPATAVPELIIPEPQISLQENQIQTESAATTTPLITTQYNTQKDSNSEKEQQLLNTVELLYKDATSIMTFIAPLAGNIMIIGKALLESDSIGERNNPYQKIIEQAIDDVVGIIVRDPYVKTLLNTVKEHAVFVWNFIGAEIESKLESKGVLVTPSNDNKL